MGLGFAKAFLEHGADVLIASRKEENLSKAASEIKDQTGKTLHWKMMDVRKTKPLKKWLNISRINGVILMY